MGKFSNLGWKIALLFCFFVKTNKDCVTLDSSMNCAFLKSLKGTQVLLSWGLDVRVMEQMIGWKKKSERWTGPLELGNWHSFCIGFIFQVSLCEGPTLPPRVSHWQSRLFFLSELTRSIVMPCWHPARVSLDLCKIMRQVFFLDVMDRLLSIIT